MIGLSLVLELGLQLGLRLVREILQNFRVLVASKKQATHSTTICIVTS